MATWIEMPFGEVSSGQTRKGHMRLKWLNGAGFLQNYGFALLSDVVVIGRAETTEDMRAIVGLVKLCGNMIADNDLKTTLKARRRLKI